MAGWTTKTGHRWRESAALERGQQGTVGVIEPRLVDLAAQDGELVTEDQDLDILVLDGAEAEHDQLKGATGGTVEEAKRHEPQLAG